jgi:aryl-alcohol dehydrogenase-like predicted oxidoreductase
VKSEEVHMTDNKKGSILDAFSMGIGTWSWGDRTWWGYGTDYGEHDVHEAFQACIKAGLTLFDTAEVYGSGKSESFLGSLIHDIQPRIYVATKFMPYPWRLSRNALRKALQRSLKRLGLTKVDLYQVHWPFPPLPVEYWIQGMIEVFQAGLIGEIGVSNYNADQMSRSIELLGKNGISLTSNQVEYNLLKRKVEKNGLLQQCQKEGIRLIAYSPMAQGVLSGKYSPQNPLTGIRERRYDVRYLARVQPLLRTMKEIGENHSGKTQSQIAINWVICKGAIPIPGAKNRKQAELNLGALGWKLTDKEIALLDEMSDQVTSA